MESHPLDFEKPILELQRRLQDLKDHSDEHELDFDSEVRAIETKIDATRREIYDNLTAWQRVQIARHTQRPFAQEPALFGKLARLASWTEILLVVVITSRRGIVDGDWEWVEVVRKNPLR